jgi:very-short-patch-repair endonuclease
VRLRATPAARFNGAVISSEVQLALKADAAPRTYRQLREALSKDGIAGGVLRGELTRLVADQYCLAVHADSWVMRSRAAVEWAGPGAALTGLAALAAYGYAPLPFELIQVAVPAGGHRTGPPWIRVRSLTMPFAKATWRPTTQLTLPALAMVLGYGHVPAQRRATFLYRAIGKGLVTPTEASEVAGVLTRIPAKKELLERLKYAHAGAESYLEERGMATIFRDVEGIVFQHRLRVRGEGFRIDAFHLPTMTAFELDGDETHGDPVDRKRDIRRDALLATIGIQTIRFARETALENPAWCRDVALETIDTRSSQDWHA